MSEEAHKEEGGSSGGHGGGGGGGHGGGGHGGGGHEEGHEGAPEWLISFADNVALLMGFFVILLAMNMGPKASTPVQGGVKGEEGGGGRDPAMDAIISIREAFHSPLREENPEDWPLIKYKKWRDGDADVEGIHGRHDSSDALKPSEFKNITASIPFDDRSSLLSAPGREKLTELATKLRDQRWIIEVRGHVSPFESMRDNTKAMDLGYERAKAVAQALVEAGVKWDNLRLDSCGANERVSTRLYDREADRGNQRVEVVVTNETIAPDPYAQGPAEKDQSTDAQEKDGPR